MASTVPQRSLGRYEIVREVGRGGTAVVYLARQTDLDRSVALKELAGLHASDPEFVERFLRESRATFFGTRASSPSASHLVYVDATTAG